MLLPAVATEEGRVEPGLSIGRIEALSVEGDAPVWSCAQGRINVAGAGKEPMQLECHECAVAGTATLVGGPAHQNEHGLKLGTTARLLAPSLCGKAPGGFGNGDGRPARQ